MGVYNLTGLLRAVLVQVRQSGDMQDQVRDGNEPTGRMEEPRFRYSWWFRRRRVRNRCLLGPHEELVNGLYSEFGLMFRQTPYTMLKNSVQQKMAETMCQNLGTV